MAGRSRRDEQVGTTEQLIQPFWCLIIYKLIVHFLKKVNKLQHDNPLKRKELIQGDTAPWVPYSVDIKTKVPSQYTIDSLYYTTQLSTWCQQNIGLKVLCHPVKHVLFSWITVLISQHLLYHRRDFSKFYPIPPWSTHHQLKELAFHSNMSSQSGENVIIVSSAVMDADFPLTLLWETLSWQNSAYDEIYLWDISSHSWANVLFSLRFPRDIGGRGPWDARARPDGERIKGPTE